MVRATGLSLSNGSLSSVVAGLEFGIEPKIDSRYLPMLDGLRFGIGPQSPSKSSFKENAAKATNKDGVKPAGEAVPPAPQPDKVNSSPVSIDSNSAKIQKGYEDLLSGRNHSNLLDDKKGSGRSVVVLDPKDDKDDRWRLTNTFGTCPYSSRSFCIEEVSIQRKIGTIEGANIYIGPWASREILLNGQNSWGGGLEVTITF